jgi:predicted amidohydrolase YtcJ
LVGLISRRQFVAGAAALVAGASFDACAPAADAPTESTTANQAATPTDAPEVVFRGGTILTMDPEQPNPGAAAVRGESIVAVGSEAEVMAATSTRARIVDLGGRVLMPGFNDAHCHRLDAAGSEAKVAIGDTLAGGWTSISEMLVVEERLDALRSLDDASELRLRVNAYLAPYLPYSRDEQVFGSWIRDYEPRQTFGARLRIGGVKLFADAFGPSAMLLTEGHADRPVYLGEAYWEADEFADLVGTLHRDGWQLATHTCGDAAHDFVLDAYESALAGVDNDLHRHRIEHAFVLRDDQVTRMRDLAVIASIQPAVLSADSATDWETALGGGRLGWAGRLQDLLEAGVPMVGGTDYPAVSNGDAAGRSSALRALWDLATRTGARRAEAPDWMTNQAPSVEQGLDLLTRA